MPIFTFTSPEGKTYDVEAPEGATQEQAFQVLQQQIGGNVAKQQPAQPETTLRGLAGAVTRGVAPIATGAALGAAVGAPIAGVGAIPGAIAGAGAVGLAQLVGDPIVGAVNSMFGTKYTLPTQAMEDLLTRVGVPEAKSHAERIVQTTAAGATGAGGLAAAGRAVQTAAGAAAPVTREVGRVLAAQPTMQVAGGAGAGAAGQIAEEIGAGPAGQIAASLAGGVAGAKLAGLRKQPLQLPSDLKEAEQAGIQVMTSDIVPPRTFAAKWLQATGEKIPLAGTGGPRQVQQTQRIDAIRNLLVDYGADDAAKASDKVMADLAAKRSADLNKYTAAKTEVIDRLGQTGTVPVTRTVKAIDDQVSKLQGLRTKEVEPVITRLEDWKAAIQDQNLGNIETLRKQIGESFKAPELASVRTTGEKTLAKIYNPLREDMAEFIKTNGERRDFDKWMVSNKRLADMAGELEMNTLKSVLRRGDATPEVVNQMLFSKKASEVRQLYGSLTPEGRANARMSILARAAEKSGGIENISPNRFANEVKKLGTSVGVFFTGEELQRIEGLTRVLNITRRAAESAVAPPTGVQVAIPAVASILTDVMGGWVAGLTTGAAVGGAARVYESAPVRNLLLKIQKTGQGSQEEAALVKRLMSVMQTQSEEIQKLRTEQESQP